MVALTLAMALAAPSAVKATAFDLRQVHVAPVPPSGSVPKRRDERIAAAALAAFPMPDSWAPPAKSWSATDGGPVIELGALGARHAWQPDIAHLSLQWHF